MCSPGNFDADARKAVAPQKLASLMNEHLGVDIDPFALKLFINAHWSKVASLAHVIHDGNKADRLQWRDEPSSIAPWRSSSRVGDYHIRVNSVGQFEALVVETPNQQGLYRRLGASYSLNAAKDLCQAHHEARK